MGALCVSPLLALAGLGHTSQHLGCCRRGNQESMCSSGQPEDIAHCCDSSEWIGPTDWGLCGLGSHPLCGLSPCADCYGLNAGITMAQTRFQQT